MGQGRWGAEAAASLLSSCSTCIRTAVVLAICHALVLTGYFPAGARALEDVPQSGAGGAVCFADYQDQQVQLALQEELYARLYADFPDDSYELEELQTRYLSDEYLRELAYNSRENIYFGYTLDELDAQFQGTKYVFSLGPDGTTVVKEFLGYDDTYERIVQNLAIGTGVLLVSATVTVVTARMGQIPICVRFAIATEQGFVGALQTAALSGAIAAVVEGIASGDPEEVVLAAVLEASEGFKVGAIAGVALGLAFPEVPSSPTVSTSVSEVVGAAAAASRGTKTATVVGDGARSFELVKLPQGRVTTSGIERGREFEALVQKELGYSESQVAFLEGKVVSAAERGSTRPDFIVRSADETIAAVEAVEVKSVDLANRGALSDLCSALKKQVLDRTTNLPKGSSQRIVLDGRGYTDEVIGDACGAIRHALEDIYPDIPITVLR